MNRRAFLLGSAATLAALPLAPAIAALVPAAKTYSFTHIPEHPTMFEVLRDMQSIHKYASEGMSGLFKGEIGRYEGIRFVMQEPVAAPRAA